MYIGKNVYLFGTCRHTLLHGYRHYYLHAPYINLYLFGSSTHTLLHPLHQCPLYHTLLSTYFVKCLLSQCDLILAEDGSGRGAAFVAAVATRLARH